MVGQPPPGKVWAFVDYADGTGELRLVDAPPPPLSDAHHALGQRLRRARIDRYLTQQECGDQAGVDFVRLSKIENGRVAATANELRRLCAVLELTPSDADFALTVSEGVS